MKPITNRQVLKLWCAKKRLTLPNISSIAFIPQGTLNHVLANDSGVLAAKARLYHLTQEEAFKLSPEEDALYQKESLNEKYDSYWDRKISEIFIFRYNKDGSLPPLEYRLIPARGEDKNKKELTNLLKRELLGYGKEKTTEEILVTKTSKKLLDLDSLEKAIDLKDDEFIEFVKKNKTEIKELASILNVMLDSDPINARNTVIQTKKIFQNYAARKQ